MKACSPSQPSFVAATECSVDLDKYSSRAQTTRCSRETSGLLGEALWCRRSFGCYRNSNCLTDPERNRRFSCDLNLDREPFGESDPIDGLVDRRIRAGATSKTDAGIDARVSTVEEGHVRLRCGRRHSPARPGKQRLGALKVPVSA